MFKGADPRTLTQPFSVKSLRSYISHRTTVVNGQKSFSSLELSNFWVAGIRIPENLDIMILRITIIDTIRWNGSILLENNDV